MDQHIGPLEAAGDHVLELVRGAVGVLERGAGAELDVQIDVAPRARPREESVSSLTPVTTIEAATRSATTGSIQFSPVSFTRTSPASTPAEVIASVRRCAASPERAAESVLRAFLPITPETKMVTTIENATTAMPRPTGVELAAARQPANRLGRDHGGADQDQDPSIAADRFSIFSCP